MVRARYVEMYQRWIDVRNAMYAFTLIRWEVPFTSVFVMWLCCVSLLLNRRSVGKMM